MHEQKIKLLLTNDDGITSTGLVELAHALSAKGEVTVVAPDRERSACGHSITMYHPLRVEPVDMGSAIHRAWAVNGTPTDCVKLAVEALMESPPDIVVSGINRGANLGTDVLYSGTVSAAVEGVIMGFPSIAISIVSDDCYDFRGSAQVAVRLIDKICSHNLPPDTVLNVNIPGGDVGNSLGIKITKLGERKYTDSFEKRIDPRGKAYYWLAGKLVDCEADEDTDTIAVKKNYISVTPIHFDFTNYRLMDELKSWDL